MAGKKYHLLMEDTAMKKNLIPLNMLPPGSSGKVRVINAEGGARRRMLDLGLIDGTKVEALRKSPLGDPVAFQIRGAVIALRREESSKILVEIC